MATKLDPIEKARRAAVRKANTAERLRIKREPIERRKQASKLKREAKAREALKRRLHKEQNQSDRLRGVYGAIIGMYNEALLSGDGHINYKILGRLIGTLIFEIRPFRFIGWKSEAYLAALAAKVLDSGKALDPTHEHLYPRQFDGEFLICHLHVMGSLSFAEFCDYVDVFRQTAHVLRVENLNLEHYQKAHKFISPEMAYEAAGVKVVQCETSERFHRLEEVAPQKVLHAFFGHQMHVSHKYIDS